MDKNGKTDKNGKMDKNGKIDTKKFSEIFIRNYEKNREIFWKETESLFIFPPERKDVIYYG